MWRKLARTHAFLYVDQPVALYRWHQGNSVKVMATRLRQWSLELLVRERDYCYRSGLSESWREAYVELLLPVVMDKNLALGKRIASLDFWQLMKISPYLGQRAINRALRIFGGRSR